MVRAGLSRLVTPYASIGTRKADWSCRFLAASELDQRGRSLLRQLVGGQVQWGLCASLDSTTGERIANVARPAAKQGSARTTGPKIANSVASAGKQGMTPITGKVVYADHVAKQGTIGSGSASNNAADAAIKELFRINICMVTMDVLFVEQQEADE